MQWYVLICEKCRVLGEYRRETNPYLRIREASALYMKKKMDKN